MRVKMEKFFTDGLGEPERTVFESPEGFITLGDFASRVAGYARFFQERPERDFAVFVTGNAGLFAEVFFGLLQSGKRVFLPSSEKMARAVSAGGVPLVCNADLLPDCAVRVPFGIDLRSGFKFADMRNSRVRFYTSGSTSAPKPIDKTFATLSDEVENILNVMPDIKGVRVVSTCEPFHLYGMLWRLLFALASGAVARTDTVDSPDALAKMQRGAERVFFVTTPTFLGKVLKYRSLFDFPRNCVRIITSGSLLERELSLGALDVWGTCPVEIFGSTESGGIASRTRTDGDEWRVFEPVAAHADFRGCLCVESPFAEGGRFATNDLVSVGGNSRTFLLKGRLDRLVKIGESQLFLPDMERFLEKSGYADSARLEVFGGRLAAAVVPSARGIELAKRGRKLLCDALTDCLRAQYEPKLLPKIYRFVHSFRPNAQGKILRTRMEAVFADAAPQPLVEDAADAGGGGFSCRLTFLSSSAFFKGHFEGFGILPGVAQLDWSIQMARDVFGFSGFPKRVKKLKFSAVIRPDETVAFALERHSENAVGFVYSKENGAPCSSGVLEF